MARKVKSQISNISKIIKFPFWILTILLSLVFVFIMYNEFKEGAVDASFSKVSGVPIRVSTQTPTQKIQAQELVKIFEEKLIEDKKANNSLAVQADEYNIEFYKSML